MDTNGWDFVCACSFAKLNQLLAIQFTRKPLKLHYIDQDGTQIDALFDPWQIIDGGSGTKLRIEMPVHTGQVVAADLIGGGVTTPIKGLVMVVEVDLAFFSNQAGDKSDLKFNFKSVSKTLGDPKAGSFTIVNPDLHGLLPKQGTVWTALHDHVPDWLVPNSDFLSYAFASLNLAPTGSGSWLTPHSTRYYCVNGSSAASGYLAMMGMITGADTSNLQTVIDPTLCDGKHDICIAFAGPVFLEHVVKPKLPGCFPGSSDANFVMQGGSIANSGSLACQPVRYGALDYPPTMDTLSIGISGANLTSSGSGSFPITGLWKSSVTFTESTKLKCDFDSTAGKLTLVKDGVSVVDHDSHIYWAVYVLAAPTLPFLGPIVIVIVDVVIAAVSAAIANSVSSNSGNVDLNAWSATSIDFPGGKSWTLQDAGLSSSFYMRCALNT